MQDHLIKATIEGGIRIYGLSAKNLVNESCKHHLCSPLAGAALGRILMGTLFLAATMKDSEAVTVKINGNGILGSLVADACAGNVRGYVDNPSADLPLKNGKLAVGEAVGIDGNILVTRFNQNADPFTGICNLASGEIAEDFTKYLYVSEQTPSSFILGVFIDQDGSVSQAGGLFVQSLPDSSHDALEIVGNNIVKMDSITTLLASGKNIEEIISSVASNLKVTFYDNYPIRFACQCDYKRIINMLISLGKDELLKISEDEQTEVKCHFCNASYLISKQEIESLYKSS